MRDYEELIYALAAPATGAERLFNDLPMEPGIHLRAAFLPALGFPPGGIRIERRYYSPSEFSPDGREPRPWRRVAHLRLPTAEAAWIDNPIARRRYAESVALERIDRRHTGAFTPFYQPEVGRLIRMLEQLSAGPGGLPFGSSFGESPGGTRDIADGRDGADGERRSRIAMRAADLLFLAALDPFIARMIGLYWIDAKTPPGRHVDYRLTGLWGDRPWPELEARLQAITPDDLRHGKVDLDAVQLVSSRPLTLEPPEEDAPPDLVVRGAGHHPLHLRVRHSVREVRLTVHREGNTSRWWHEAHGPDGRRVSLDLLEEDDTLILRGRVEPFQTLELAQRSEAEGTLRISGLRYRLRMGAIGNLSTELSPPLEARDVHPPAIGRHRQLERPASARREAEAFAHRPGTHPGPPLPEVLELTCRVPGGEGDPARPSRLEVRRGAVVDPGTPAERLASVALLTSPAVGAFPTVTRLARWTLDGTPGSGTRFGVTGFIPRAGISGERQALWLNGDGFVEVAGPHALRTLGQSLVIQAWVYPQRGRGYHTLVGNHWRESFWLALKPSSRRLRLWLNRRRFESEGTLALERWSHVTVVYDGREVRFYIDGLMEPPHDAVLGHVRPNPRDVLCLGAESGSTAERVRFGFHGRLADVHLWRLEAPQAHPLLRELVAAWPLAGSVDEAHALETDTTGTVWFTADHPEDHTRQVLSLDGTGHLAASVPALASLDAALTIEAWVWPAPGLEYPTIVGNDWRRSVWLGLETGGYRLRGWLNGRLFHSEARLPARQWSHVRLGYDGHQVRFFVNGRPDAVHEARLGPVLPSSRPTVDIGADAGAYRFQGRLSDVRIWRVAPEVYRPAVLADPALVAAWSLNGDVEDRQLPAGVPVREGSVDGDGGPLDRLRGSGRFPARHPEDPDVRVLELEGHGFVETAPRPALRSPSSLTLEARVFPSPGQGFPTLIGNGWRRSVWLGLDTGSYRLRLWLNGRVFHSKTGLPADRWSDVAVTYDGREVVFYVNGPRVDVRHDADLGALRPNDGPLCLGAESGSRPADLDFPFRGMLADVHLWARALAPGEAALLLPRQPPAGTFIDDVAPVGDHRYATRGIDLFGQTSPWKTAPRLEVLDTRPPAAPMQPRARFRPLTGVLDRVRPLAPPSGEAIAPLELATDIALPADADAAAVTAALAGYDVRVLRDVRLPGGETGRLREVFEIQAASVGGTGLTLTVMPPLLARLRPESGDDVRIDFDLRLEVTLGWSGQHHLQSSDARELRVYLQTGPVNELHGRIHEIVERTGERFRVETDAQMPSVPAALEGLFCQVGAHQYRIADVREVRREGARRLGLELVYSARPVQPPEVGAALRIPVASDSPLGRELGVASTWAQRWAVAPIEPPVVLQAVAVRAVPVEDDAYLRLRRDEAPWLPPLPEPEEGARRNSLRVARLEGVSPPEAMRTMRAEDFVPGVLVAFDLAPDTYGWRQLPVVWQAWRPSEGLDLYLLAETFERPAEEELELASPRYVPGRRISVERAWLPDVAPSEGTLELRLGATAADGTRDVPDHRGEDARYGLESGVTSPAMVVAVDRRRPPRPSPPAVEIDAADFYGDSVARVTWTPPTGGGPRARYQVYHATDTAVFARDTLQRRLRTGAYRPALRPRPDDVMGDDPDFEAWLEARFPERVADWGTTLFVPQPDDGDRGAWEAATAVWQAWSERFYPALSPTGPGPISEVQALAGLEGNEEAFALLNAEPLATTTYRHTVRGLTANRHLYRLRTLGPAFTMSDFGPSSAPAAAVRVRRPRPPVITGVDAGDRRVALRWAIPRATDLEHWRVYRADSAEALEDLRWFGPGDDPRWVATVSDPRLKAGRGRLELPPGPDLEPRAVYRLDAYDRARDPTDQPRALNYLLPSSAWDGDARVLEGLRRIEPGTPVLVVYRAGGAVGVIDRVGDAPPYVDADLAGLQDYFYRLQAVSEAGVVSAGSEVKHARPLEIAPPPVPDLAFERAAGADSEDTVTIRVVSPAPELELLVKRRLEGERLWRVVMPWADLSRVTEVADALPSDAIARYRVSARTRNRTVSREVVDHMSLPGS